MNEATEILGIEEADIPNSLPAENEQAEPDEGTDKFVEPVAFEEEQSENETAEEALDEQSETERLLAQISSLQEQIRTLEAQRAADERMYGELSEFCELFPEISPDAIPEEVWESVKSGNSLSASYALYEKKMHARRARAEAVNESNARCSAGMAGVNTQNEYYSPDEVRRMSPAEVHANYQKIKASMKKWL